MLSSERMNYTELVGDYATAYADVAVNGGQLYPGNGKDSANVVVRGRNCFVYWKIDSRRHQEVKELCQFFNIDSNCMTGGRLARYLINDVLELPYKDTFWSKRYRTLARQGNHWHYTHVIPWQQHLGVEFDIKSAYMSSFLQFPTLLYKEGVGYLPDNNAMEGLRVIIPTVPKWFRLQLLGCLASWRFGFLTKDKKSLDSSELIYKSIQKITFNAAFNTAHRAILRTFKVMEKIHKIGGQHIKRIHTDSFFLSWECPEEIENEIWSFLESKGLEVSVKGSGEAFFFDLNTGFIGKKFVGSALDVASLMRENGVKRKPKTHEEQLIERFGPKISTNPNDNKNCKDENSDRQELEQLSLL